jgi:hypothetical protein
MPPLDDRYSEPNRLSVIEIIGCVVQDLRVEWKLDKNQKCLWISSFQAG